MFPSVTFHHRGDVVLSVVWSSLPKPGLLSQKKKKEGGGGGKEGEVALRKQKINSPGLQLLSEVSAQALGSLNFRLVVFVFVFFRFVSLQQSNHVSPPLSYK